LHQKNIAECSFSKVALGVSHNGFAAATIVGLPQCCFTGQETQGFEAWLVAPDEIRTQGNDRNSLLICLIDGLGQGSNCDQKGGRDVGNLGLGNGLGWLATRGQGDAQSGIRLQEFILFYKFLNNKENFFLGKRQVYVQELTLVLQALPMSGQVHRLATVQTQGGENALSVEETGVINGNTGLVGG